MLGWHISVYRQRDGGAAPAPDAKPEGPRIAVWQAGLDGCGWIDELARTGKAINYGGTGYPNRYTARARDVIPIIRAGPPDARSVWAAGEHDVLTSGWAGSTAIDEEAAARCAPDEWLLVEIWDES
jgi:hypothetical protein